MIVSRPMKLSRLIAMMAVLALFGVSVGQRPSATNALSLVRITDAKADYGYEYIFTINNMQGYKTIEGLKQYIANLPRVFTFIWNTGYCRLRNGLLLNSQKEMDAFKVHCETNIALSVVPTG